MDRFLYDRNLRHESVNESGLHTDIQTFFISNAFFNSASLLLNFLMNLFPHVAYVLLNTYKIHQTETLLISYIYHIYVGV